MSFAIKLLMTARGIPTPQDGKFIVSYDPEPVSLDTPYDGGVLVTTDRVEDAKLFHDIAEAHEYWMLGPELPRRADGQKERPLTAWTIELVRVDEPC
jgi:hypothetical protein